MNKRRKKKASKSKQKTTFDNAKCTMGSPKRRNHETRDLNPSPVAQNKLCKEMGKKSRKTPGLKKVFLLPQLLVAR